SPIALELDQSVGGQFLERIPHDKTGRIEVLTELALHESLPRRIITPDDGGTQRCHHRDLWLRRDFAHGSVLAGPELESNPSRRPVNNSGARAGATLVAGDGCWSLVTGPGA